MTDHPTQMHPASPHPAWPHCDLPPTLQARPDGDIALLALARPEKRNALNIDTVLGIERFFDTLPSDIKAVVLHGIGDHFCAGLDLSEAHEMDTTAGVAHSRTWHRAFSKIEFGTVPVVSVLHGAVVGGGLEIAASTHIRVAEDSAYYAFPEGIRGIFVGGGGSVRVSRLLGASRMAEMMLTGRTYGAAEGLAFALSHYVVPKGEGLTKGLDLARRVAGNAPMSNFALIQALPRIADADPATGLLLEALMSSVAAADGEAKKRLRAFLDGRAAKVSHG